MATAQRETLGLFELDRNGTVVYSSMEDVNGSLVLDEGDSNGRNFFSDVATFTNVEELSRRLEAFKADHTPARSFNFICHYPFGAVPVRVLLARMGRTLDGEPTSFLVHLKRCASEGVSV